jgi:hypothetical protein
MEDTKTDISETRIRALENKIQGMEPLVKGLIEETVDLKSVFLASLKNAGEFNRQDRGRETIVWGSAHLTVEVPTKSPSMVSSSVGNTGIQAEGALQPEVPASPAESGMVMIMQADGTMKMESRCGDRNQTDSTAGYGPNRMAHLSRAKRSL